MYVGFERVRIQPLNFDGTKMTAAGDQLVIEGKTDAGGVVQAEISGISKEAKFLQL